MLQATSRFNRLHGLRLIRVLLGFALFCTACFLVYLGFAHDSSEALRRIARKKNEIDTQHLISQSDKRMMLDSLVTILQDYYVDEKKVESLSLLKSTLAKLQDDLNIDVIQEKKRTLKLVFDDSTLTLSIDEPYTYSQLLKHMVYISEFLDELISKGKLQEAGNNQDDLNNGSYIVANEMLAGLDEHSALLDSYSYDELKQSTEGAFGGLGIIVGIRNNILTVLKPIPDSPASKSGIRKGDRITKINGISTYGVPLNDMINTMRGNPGTAAELVILRDGKMSSQTISLKREVIKLDSVTHTLLATGKYKALHISIDTFSATTSRELRLLFKKYLQDDSAPVHGIILDLRSNPGGLLDQAAKVADLFLQQGNIVSTVGRYKEKETASRSDTDVHLPVVVLINSDSASASEIVAGALQDNNRAIIIGQPSFGKGSVQTIFEYPPRQAIKLTIAKYYTPLGRSIQSVGITPDIWLQPIIQSNNNINVFGDYRYHQLESTYILPDNLAEKEKMSIGYTIKSNYLAPSLDDNTDLNETRNGDFEIQFGLLMLRSLLDHYGPVIPDGMQRASHWLAIATNAAQSYLKKPNADALNFLRQKYHVDWTGTVDPKAPTESLTFDFINSPKTQKEGRPITMEWEIANHSSRTYPNVSLFMGPHIPGYDYTEQAVGKLRAFERKKGTITLPGINKPHLGKIFVKGGIATGHVPLVSSIRKVEVVVKPEEKPKLYGTAILCDSRNQKPVDAIKPQDEVKLEVTIFNEGDVRSSHSEIDLENLSGGQIAVAGSRFYADVIEPRTRIRHYFTLKASDALFSNKLSFGIKINSADLVQPIFQEISINALPNSSTNVQQALLSH